MVTENMKENWKISATFHLTGLFLVPVNNVHILNPQNDLRGSLWGYGQQDGPHTWLQEYPTCNGSMQSPINLNPSLAALSDPGPLHFVGYDMELGANLENNGHTVVLSLSSLVRPYMFGGRLPGKERFEFLQSHWHWGSSDSQGSEHRLNGEAFPMELHMVHWNTKYESVEEAVNRQDGLAVVAFLYQISTNDNEDLTGIVSLLEHLNHPEMTSKLAKNYHEIMFQPRSRQLAKDYYKVMLQPRYSQSSHSTHNQELNMKLESFLPSDHASGSYYYYQGSLTTPTCDESVLWTVFDTPLTVSEEQMESFRKINGFEGETLSNNFRKEQPIGAREVFYREVVTAEGGDLAVVDQVVGMVVVAATIAMLGVLLYLALVTLTDVPRRRLREVEDFSVVREVERMVKLNKYI